MSDTLFELSCNQTITPTVGTYTGADNNTPVYELVDSDYYLKNTSSHGYYFFNVTNIASRMKISFDCVFNYKSGFSWILQFERQYQNWWGIGSYYSDLILKGVSNSDQTLKTNITDGTKLHIDIQIKHSTSANVVTIFIDNTEVLNINLPSTYELSNFEILGNINSYVSNCYIKDLSIVIYGTNYLNKNGLSEAWTNIKNYITAQLLGKSDEGHTHTKSEITDFPTIPTKTSDLTNDSGFLTSHQDLSGYIPVSGGAVLTNYFLGRSVDTGSLMLSGGTSWSNGGSLEAFGSGHSSYAGQVRLQPALSNSNFKTMSLAPNGTWTWSGAACQITSDQRLKQQITEIDDKLLDAWEDVNLVQFKYNDAVKEKSDNARLHTGYVVQQIDKACKSHNVDISQYGLYCHEEYPQETEEVEVEQADGTKTKERKVIRDASEHYSLRYTEALIVECKYLRRCIARLTARIEELEKGNNTK